MSHATGEVLSLTRERLGWFEYNGTCDVCCARVYKNEEDLHENWRADNRRECVEPQRHTQEEVILFSHYGGGFYWLGKVCFSCMAITDGLLPGYLDGNPYE